MSKAPSPVKATSTSNPPHAASRTLLVVLGKDKKGELESTLQAILVQLDRHAGLEVLFIDDASVEEHTKRIEAFAKKQKRFHHVQHAVLHGSGGMQKLAFSYATQHNYETIVITQCSPSGVAGAREIGTVMKNARAVDCALGINAQSSVSRVLGNVLGKFQYILAGVKLQAWHSACRAYRVSALREICFEFNTSDHHFDIETLLQLYDRGKTIVSVPLQSPPLGETRLLLRPRYWRDALKATLKYRLQKYSLFYDVRYHPESVLPALQKSAPRHYPSKFDSLSPHTFVTNTATLIPQGAKVLDLGCSSGFVARSLAEQKGCKVIGVDLLPPAEVNAQGFEYRVLDLENDFNGLRTLIEKEEFDVVLMLDVIEHLKDPELFLLNLYRAHYRKRPIFVLSTANVAFVVVRFMLAMGYFNYGERGILDVTHKRLFSARTFKNLLDQTGFSILRRYGFPAPYQSLGFPKPLSKSLERINLFLIRLRLSLFAYQVMLIAVPQTSAEQLARSVR